VAPCVEWSVVRISVLGPLRVEAGQSAVPVGGRQLRLLLILLALEAGRMVPAAVLAARLLSPGREARARPGWPRSCHGGLRRGPRHSRQRRPPTE